MQRLATLIGDRWPDRTLRWWFNQARISSFATHCRAALLVERDRWILWLPVFFGCGIAFYFILPIEPSLWLTTCCAATIPILLYASWHRAGAIRIVLLCLALTASGFIAAEWRARSMDAPVIPRAKLYDVEGRVLLVEPREKGVRLLLDELSIDRLTAESTPERVRITVRREAPGVSAGDRISLLAHLRAPSGPALPGGFDFARHAFFEQIGGIGYSVVEPEIVRKGSVHALSSALARIRQFVAQRATQIVEGQSGGVAAALLTGLRGDIAEHIWSDMQLAGLAHLLAISGLHMGLIAGTVFMTVRYGVALIPWIALRWPAKKIAAAVALPFAAAYLLLAGAPIPTQRAFLMVAVALTAIMLDRNPLSMRLVAFAALIVLMFRPESLLGASFQMSFAAVTALIAFYEQHRYFGERRGDPETARAWWHLPMVYFIGVALTTLVAGLATMPFAAVHFQRVASYGLLANLLAVPLTAFWIMPLGLLSLILMPFGLDSWPLQAMGIGINWLLQIAKLTADLPHAGVLVSQLPEVVLPLVAIGGLWLCLWRRPWRWWGALIMLAALVVAMASRPPDIVIDRRGEMVAYRDDSGVVHLQAWRKNGFVQSVWLRALGVGQAAPWPDPWAGREGDITCDNFGCTLDIRGRKIGIVRHAAAVAEDCHRLDLVIAVEGSSLCDGNTTKISGRRLWFSGGMTLKRHAQGFEIRTVADERGDRLWSNNR